MSDPEHLPDSVLLGPQEAGFPAHEGPMIPSLPAGLGKGAFPHFLSFSELVNYASRTYRWNHDEALRHSTANALAMRRDPIVMSALRARQIPVSQLSWHIDCQNPEDIRQSSAAKLVTDLIKRTPRLQQMMMCLLEAVFYGRYAIQISYGWDFTDGKRRMVVKDFKPINGDKMAFRWSGNAGILVHALFEGDWEITERGRTHFFTDYERDQLVIHKHEPEDADFFEASLAGGVHGVGVRSRIYWFWYLRSQTMSFLMDYLERMGAGGLTIAYYEHGNPQSLEDVKSCMENQFKNHTILFPRYRDTTTGGPGIERIEPSNNGAQLLESLVTNYFDAQIRRLILGQDLTSQTGPGGSDGVATLHGETFNRIIKYDSVALQDTLTQDFVRILQKYNVPHDIPPLRWVFDVDKVNAGEMLEAANQFYQMGGSIDEDELRTTIGLSRPKHGGAILTQNMPMNPATLGTVPEGTPMEGMPAPDLGAPVQMSRIKYQKDAPVPKGHKRIEGGYIFPTYLLEREENENSLRKKQQSENEWPEVLEKTQRMEELMEQFDTKPGVKPGFKRFDLEEFMEKLPIQFHDEFNKLESDRAERIKRHVGEWKVLKEANDKTKRLWYKNFPEPKKPNSPPESVPIDPKIAVAPKPALATVAPRPVVAATRPAPRPIAVAPRPAPGPIVAAPRPVAPALAAAPKLAAAPRLPIPVAPKPLVAVAPKPAPNLGALQSGAV